MTRCIILAICVSVLTATSAARAVEKQLPVCTVKALTPAFPGGLNYQISLTEPGGAQAEVLHRVRTLAEAVHFVLAERRHHTCRAAAPSERRSCVFSTVNQRLVMSYAGHGRPPEPVATFASQAHASHVLRQMRNVYLCN